ncbi:YdbL family protein [Denitromonas iodatirespirans]|uniref:YdbL family protein n=1 Tax=Denitromonas iodatirespirans TaxID=2795389 RepID=A0A944D8B1_DENI1|nr:YdbL family protein [Denitromonas iodatirespirans]MBT0961950.1 YdbL family protein [Denitromonas iodatirespirans]
MKAAWKFLMAMGLFAATLVFAQGNLEVNTPAIAALKASMADRHAQLAPLYASGAVGLKSDGSLAVHDANAVPLAQRSKLNTLVAAENSDRAALYREIAAANGHPEWADDIRRTFAQRWIDKAPSGWWVQDQRGWARK